MTYAELLEEILQAAMRVDEGKATRRDFAVLDVRVFVNDGGRIVTAIDVPKAITAGLLDPGEGL